jgi:hypothetical protein
MVVWQGGGSGCCSLRVEAAAPDAGLCIRSAWHAPGPLDHRQGDEPWSLALQLTTELQMVSLTSPHPDRPC